MTTQPTPPPPPERTFPPRCPDCTRLIADTGKPHCPPTNPVCDWIRCDGDDDSDVLCDEEVYIQSYRSEAVTVKAVRDKAAADGWQWFKGLDRCPQHRTDTLIHATRGT